MLALTREEILNASDLVTEMVNVPEWGGNVYVRCLTGEERDELESLVVQDKSDGNSKVDLTNFRARLVALSVVNEKGDRIFTLDDVVKLGKKSAKALEKVFNVAERLSSLRNKDSENAIKNS